jgi:hypothetical protein
MWLKRGALGREDHMDERRRSVRQRCFLYGRVYFNNGRNALDCIIRDISYEGARIVFSEPVNIPDEIRLAIPERNRMFDAIVRWRHANTIGVVFSELVPRGRVATAAAPRARLER